MLRIDARQLKAALLPSPTALLVQLQQILPEIAATMYNMFIEGVHTATHMLKSSISNVEEYVQRMAFLEECKVLTSSNLRALIHCLVYQNHLESSSQNCTIRASLAHT